MTPEQRETAVELAKAISAKTMAAEKRLEKAIALTTMAVALADEIAGDNRTGDDAKYALRIRAHQDRLISAYTAIKATHAEASILQCEVLNIPMTRGGER